MYQRLLFLLSVLFISGVSMAQNNDVMTPNDGDNVYPSFNPAPVTNKIQAWMHDPSQTNRIPASVNLAFKSYRYNNTSFRLRFPNNYNPANKYPLIIFFHGAGESASAANGNNSAPLINRANQDQLYWGADTFNLRINRGEWNGFLLFPQLFDNSFAWGNDNGSFQNINTILDTLEKYNGLDPDRVMAMGLSEGGLGVLDYANYYPKRLATAIPSVPAAVNAAFYTFSNFLHIPVWMCAANLDGGVVGSTNGCDPASMFANHDKFRDAGGNMYFTFSTNETHGMWNTQWNQRDVGGKYILSKFWNTAHKAQPLLYFQNDHFCTGQTINAKMGLTPGYNDYQWQYDNGTGFIQVASGVNEYTATQAGKYRVRFQRLLNGPWSGWTPNPVVITSSPCNTDTAFVEHFDLTRDWYGNNQYKFGANGYVCLNGLVLEATDGLGNSGSISQDGAGVFGGKFILNSTVSNAGQGCSYAAGDEVYRNQVRPINVQPNTDYVLSFSMANQNNFFGGGTNPSLATSLSAYVNHKLVTPAAGVKASGWGNTSWRKYSFLWNSAGSPSNPEISITNNQGSATWNDFALDEVMLVKYKVVTPGAAFKDFTLWAKGNSINGTDGTGVGLWTNNNFNGDNLVQPTISALPLLKNNAADNINFNPIVNFSGSTGQYMQAPAGFSGSNTHTAVTAYVVAKFNTLAQDDKNILIENQQPTQTDQTSVKVTLSSNGRLSWTTGLDPDYGTHSFANTISTPASSIEVNKPSVWSFSKDNNNTASGNKQDIRKNGVVLATGSNTSTFKGNGSGTPFSLGNTNQFFDGNIAEVIYLLDSTVTPLAQNKVESYLALKYGTSMGNNANPINYTASDGTTVFWTGDATFQNDVFGIGTDSASGLVQKISNSANSGSGDGTGQSAKGNLVLSTNTNLLDKRFLMIGNSQAPFTQINIPSGPYTGSTRIRRNWKVKNTGVGSVTLSFDTTGISNLGNQSGPNTLNRYALLVNNSADTSYATASTTYIASSMSGNKIIFSGVTLPTGATFTIITNNLNFALPAVWLGFTAEAVNGNGVLNWKTSDEINVDRYTVEHSYDGVSFSAVGFVIANNSTGVNNYTLTHTGLTPGIHYYRIRRTDKDGKFEFSDIKSIKITTTGANVQVRPNPVVGSTLVLAVAVQQSSKTNVQVMAVDGKILLQQKVTLTTGSNLVNLNIANLPSGVYMVQVQLTDEVVTKKFIRQQ